MRVLKIRLDKISVCSCIIYQILIRSLMYQLKPIHGTLILGIDNEPVNLNVYYYNSKKKIKIIMYSVIPYTNSLFGTKHINHEFEFAIAKDLCII